jgi:hypothetical protein
MDALKFAFEIMIVGVLALPWIAVLIQLFAPTGEPIDIFEGSLSAVPETNRAAVAAALILAVGYFLGSTLTRISRDFFDDEMFGRMEAQIRNAVYTDEYCKHLVLRDVFLPQALPLPQDAPKDLCAPPPAMTASERKADKFNVQVQEFFRLQEGALELKGDDKVQRLKQYFDQIIVLRGAALNATVLFWVSLFGFLGSVRARHRGGLSTFALLLVPGVLFCGGIFSLFRGHWGSTVFRDPPLAEIVLILLGATGFAAIAKAKGVKRYLPTCAVAAVLAVLSSGAWWWTEVMYDLQVIHSLPQGTGSTAQQAGGPAEADIE